MLTLLRFHAERNHPLGACEGNAFLPSSSSSCRLATGRSAIAHLIRCVRPTAALIPAYIAEGIIRPFSASGISVLYYRLTGDLSPDIADMSEQLARAGKRPLVIVVHYFGYPAPVAPVRRLVDEAGGFLLEDCAHALVELAPDGAKHGAEADFVVYSLNKFLPVVDGALLLSRRSDIDVSLADSMLPPLPTAAHDAYSRHLALNAELAAGSDADEATELLRQSGEAYDRYYRFINEDMRPCKQSLESRMIEDAADFAEIAMRRRANAAIVHRCLTGSRVFRLVNPEFPSGASPFGVPVRVPAEERQAIAKSLLRAGIVASTLVDKWNFIPANDSDRYAIESIFLTEHLLLPVSEHITEDAIRAMACTLREVA